MKVYDVNYKVNSKDDDSYIIIADFHGDFDVKVAEYIRSSSPRFVIIAGDIMNGLDWNYNIFKLKRLRRFLEIIRENHIVVMSLGDHDLWRLTNEGLCNYKKLECRNIIPLYNNSCTVDNNIFDNFVPDKTCYSYPKQNTKETVDKVMEQYNKLQSHSNEKYINHLVSHNPYHFYSNEAIETILPEYDIIETGHFHDGWVPTSFYGDYEFCIDKGIQELCNKSFMDLGREGLTVTPYRNLSRGLVYMYDNCYYVLLPNGSVYYYDKISNKYSKRTKQELMLRLKIDNVPPIVITGAINTFGKLRMFYPYITTVELTKDNTYEGIALTKKC